MFPLQTGTCRYSIKGKAGSCSSFRILPYGDEKTLQAAAASVGPVAVAINARLPSFHLYRGGEVEVEAHRLAWNPVFIQRCQPAGNNSSIC